MNVLMVNYSVICINLGSEKSVLKESLLVSSSFSSKYLFLSANVKSSCYRWTKRLITVRASVLISMFILCFSSFQYLYFSRMSPHCCSLLHCSSYFHDFQYSTLFMLKTLGLTDISVWLHLVSRHSFPSLPLILTVNHITFHLYSVCSLVVPYPLYLTEYHKCLYTLFFHSFE
jgi:hypothetical protein